MGLAKSRLIEFLAGERIRFALVTEDNGKKLQIIDQNGRQQKIAAQQVICRFDRKLGREEIGEAIAEIEPAIEQLMEEVDLPLLWETVHTSNSAYQDHSLEELAGIYFDDESPLARSAIFRSLFDEEIYFRRKGVQISSRAPKQVEELRVKVARTRKRQEMEERVRGWLDQVFTAEALPEADEELLQEAEDILYHHKQNTLQELLEEKAEDSPRELAFEILQKYQRLPEDADPLLLVSGIRKDFSERSLDAAAEIGAYTSTGDRERLEAEVPVFSIDDAETREVDDAISVSQVGDLIRVGIHITDVASFISPDSILDRDARKRITSVYLPSGTVTMLPPTVSCEKASLLPGELRPALSLFADFNSEGQLVDWRFARTEITVAEKLNYDSVDALFPDAHNFGDASVSVDCSTRAGDALRLLRPLCESLFSERLSRKAIVINRPEIKIKVEGSNISIERLPEFSPSRRIIQELMILYNSKAAEFARSREVPILFRCQDPPRDKSFPSGELIEYKPEKMGQLFRQLKPARLSLKAAPHAAVGAEVYSQVSSPLRRYTDLVMQRQLSASLRGEAPVYGEDELLRLLASIGSIERDLMAVEKKSLRFWSLEYLAQKYKEEELSGTVTEKKKNGLMVELDLLPVRGFLPGANTVLPGDTVRIRINKINARDNSLYFSK